MSELGPVLGDKDGLCDICGRHHPARSQPHAFRGTKPRDRWVRRTKPRKDQDGNNTPGVSPTLRARILKRDNNRCGYCGAAGPHHIDHIAPVWNYGESEPLNLVTACTTCNLSKGASTDPTWLHRLAEHGSPRMRIRARKLIAEQQPEPRTTPETPHAGPDNDGCASKTH